MPERTFSSPEYRYGFNGKEKDEEGEWGSLTHYDYGFRIYNPGVARFLSVDPLTQQYPFYTPYQYAGNKPIRYIDLDGLEESDPPFVKNNVHFVRLYNPYVNIVTREDGTKFTTTALGVNSSTSIEFTVNTAQYERNGLSNPYFGPTDNSSWTAQGLSIEDGKHVTGRSSPETFYFAQSTSDCGQWSCGFGDPPPGSNVAIGGGVPVIINGLAYGERNIYSKDAPEGLPIVGDPGKENRKFLEQRSNAGFPKQNSKTLGKVVIGLNSNTGEFLLAIQQDGVDGMTLTQLRDHLISLGYDNALSFDGSSSSSLIIDEKIKVTPSNVKDNTIPVGVTFKTNKKG